MENRFYVGQEVVAIEDHYLGNWKKGQEFIILDIRKNKCCGNVTINIGIKTNYDFTKCSGCNDIRNNDDYYNAKRFAPKQQLSETTYNEIQEWIKKGKEISILN